MGEIYLFRHGQAAFGERDYDRLTAVGIRQSRILADHLFTRGVGFDAVYCGRMKRHLDTAREFCRLYGCREPGLREPVVLEAFDEYDARALLISRSRLEGGPETPAAEAWDRLRSNPQAFQAYFAETVNRWLNGEYDPFGLETWEGFRRRVTDGITRIVADSGRGKRLAVFTSGGPISAVLMKSLDLAGRVAVELSWQIQNASLTAFKYRSDRLALSVFNNTTHLLLENDPTLMTYR